jgi:hypothetical protein
MAALIASHLVAAFITIALGDVWEFDASPEEISAPTTSSSEAQVDPNPVELVLHSPLISTLAAIRSEKRSEKRDRAQTANLVRDYGAAEPIPGGGYAVAAVPVTRPLLGSAVHLEMPRMAPNGQFTRPRIVLGLVSSEMKSWMRAQGIAAEQCMLPLVRARARLNQETREFSAGLTLFARCTFY